MKFLRNLLYPISLLYGLITSVRNYLYENAIIESTQFDTPTIVVGNLSVGGTGKTPQIEYLIRLLKDNFKVAVLSRGYKRKSEGFVLADKTATAETIGDEPFQYYKKFNNIIVCVDADRTNAIEELEHIKNPPEIVLLDDAFQHRKVKGGLNILLTAYNNLYVNDVMLPTGNLRESKKGAKRAQVIIVTKCPNSLSEKEQVKITKKLRPSIYQKVFFTTIDYNNELKGANSITLNEIKNKDIILITGIANPKPLTAYLSDNGLKFKHLKFKDHHQFTIKDIVEIKKLQSNNAVLLTTEKDYVRIFDKLENLYYLPIETKFINRKNDFENIIKKYVEQSSRNS
ncbi:tetraacyldisaccharide 4'-kinase [Lutibacter sp.]|uniref:tetraacyldisaccharide 4'-kinase n=1 Tax=Lutibacter sp. TaxID=1925666 RepID=UPI001A255E63|nr:tetraacyldisaccharide 4'-kinase [Lutibacter sp.]MBI9041787.1 tetraacyldisaccharide 4'-kinase [Lutibacter sp.]